MEFFADDGINFQPQPTNTKESFRKRPAPATPPPVTLNWEPVYADVSRAGDLGYTTGPYTLTDNSPEKRPARHGYYFSIWKKQTDGSWKVVVDAGVQTPAPQSAKAPPFQSARRVKTKGKAAASSQESARAELMSLDREFLKAVGSRGTAKAFLDYMDDDARLHRNGVFPLTGKTAIAQLLSAKPLVMSWEPIKSDVSQSGDLGYTYGSYELKDSGAQGEAAEKGYYVRVWRRDETGRWRLVLDTTHPIPKAS
jgi:ketosteroid isomerase-like protein